MPTTAAGSWPKKARNPPRGRRRVSLTLPGSSDSATSKTTFATSTAATVCFSMGSSFSFSKGDSGTLMPIEAQGGVHFINAPDEADASDGASPLNSVLGGLPEHSLGASQRGCGMRPRELRAWAWTLLLLAFGVALEVA